ncbi:c-type cytochrome [Jannaschia ovalis]|uniref:C-type cytochrome n=1 Tax=Jannaschia ovalis TaxID=3038773 RepID=A0ABY8LEA1_9RHOB|nr:c-type cytochrome [Jannaschia sp. GRR-S6-38]WGH79626.1 c-type cytochrome [Jannaschia sp. GRR-S6-38]
MSKLAKMLVPALAGTAALVGVAYVGANRIAPPLVPYQAPVPVAETQPEASDAAVEAMVAEVKAPPVPADGTARIVQAAAPAPEAAPEPVVLDLGRPALPEEVAAWDIDIRPDGAGLPEGSGDVWTGEELYVDNCAVCHGDFGEAIGRWPVLAGGQGTLTRDRPVKTIGSYWPYLSTVYDYVHRAMPFGNAQSLSDDEVYAITAYLLYLNDLVDDDFVLDRETLAGFEMPNQDAFYMDDRAETEYLEFIGEPCMENCRETVEITARAAVVDVTPEDEAARIAREAAATGTDSGVTEADAAVEVAAAAAEAVTEDGATPLAATATEDGPDPELVAAGEAVFKKCASCHQVGEGARNRTGPALNGIVGHPVGAIEGFRYSNALKTLADAGTVWDANELAAFLAAPRDYAPGTKMSFRGLTSQEDLDAVIAYLGTFEE